MELCLPTVGSNPSKNAIEARIAGFCTLDSHGLAHYRASPAQNLKVGDCASTGRDMSGRCRKRAECGGGGFVEEWAHRARLPEEGFHYSREQFESSWSNPNEVVMLRRKV